MLFKSKKVMSMFMIFVIVFTYFGETLEAIATTDGLSAVTNGFFKTGEMQLDSYFIQNDEKTDQITSDVNEKVTLVFEISPNKKKQGFLKTGTIQANNLEESDINFKFSKIKNVLVDEPEEKEMINNQDEELKTENLVEEELEIGLNEFSEEIMLETPEETTVADFEIEIVKDNQINVQNVIHHTTIEVEIEYNKKDEFEIADLQQEINLKLNGTYIDTNLEKTEIEEENTVQVGWNYHKEIEIAGEYTKFSPFKLGEHTGILVESKINVKRQTEEENYLPIKQTVIEIDVPDFNGKAPETVNVQATKLMATKGEDVGNVSFEANNWNYDSENKKITILVSNEKDGKAIKSIGEDEYVVVYRYSDYTEEEIVTMQNNFKVTVEEYSANNNQTTTKEFSNLQEIKTQINDLITYNISSTEEKLSKAKINANYNAEEASYESEFTTTVNVNILTSDILEEFKINSSKEVYLNKDGTEFDATYDVYYNRVKFNYPEIKAMLQKGATIEIQSASGTLLYTLNDELVQNQDSCEIRLESKEKGMYVVFKNIAINGNVTIEFTKAIEKSSYDRATFYQFKEIKSYISAELKYKNYEERYGMSEIATSKKMQDSQTAAEIVLTNNNLITTAKNDGVELRIALNNDKQDSDLFVNPIFELVFPKHITGVTIENINLAHNCGLEIASFETYTEDNLVKIRIKLAGVQTRFSESVITDGTNLILNLNLTLNEYTPKRQDQIKMYYYNEAVTNYESQTEWTMKENIPEGILQQTNGFDAEIVNYQAPNGFVTANAIINYDGQANKIKSINQGEKTAQIAINKDSQIATMELVAMNNTGNGCSNVVFLGRMPFEENKSVITEENLGSTATVRILSEIKENNQNPNMTTIYYSTKENASKDLSDSSNGWTTTVENWNEIKSYMIVVKGELKAGIVLKYTYDFEIPANLNYNTAIYGSFGAYYNQNMEMAVLADKIGLKTEENTSVQEEQNSNTETNNTENSTSSTSSVTNSEAKPIHLNISQSTNAEGNIVQEGEEIEFILKIENASEVDMKQLTIYNDLSEFLEPGTMKYYTETGSGSSALKSQNVKWSIFSLGAGQKYEIRLVAKVKEDTSGQTLHNQWKVTQKDMEDFKTEEIAVKILKAEDDDEMEEDGTYSISGTTWIDRNGNGIRDEGDSYGAQAQMQLMKDGVMIKAKTTNQDGSYKFTGLTEGQYTLVSNYDKNNYSTTTYATNITEEQVNSSAYETTEGVAVTDSIQITNSNISNVDIGLVEKDRFDFKITQSIQKAIVTIDGEEKEYQYDDLELAKLEIEPNKLKDAIVKLQYNIKVENVGNVNGKVSSIVDYLPNGMYFVEKDNPFWSLGTDGNIYYAGLKDTTIVPGDFQEVKLILCKKMTEDNTGVLSNKVKIAYAESDARLTEAIENNFASQETIVTVTQGAKAPMIIIGVSFITIIATFGYMIKTGYFKEKKLIKKVYR